MDTLNYNCKEKSLTIFQSPSKNIINFGGIKVYGDEVLNLITYSAKHTLYLLLSFVCLCLQVLFTVLELYLKFKISILIKFVLLSAMMTLFILYFVATYRGVSITKYDKSSFHLNIAKQSLYELMSFFKHVNNGTSKTGRYLQGKKVFIAEKGDRLSISGKCSVKSKWFYDSASIDAEIKPLESTIINTKKTFNPLPIICIVVGVLVIIRVLVWMYSIFSNYNTSLPTYDYVGESEFLLLLGITSIVFVGLFFMGFGVLLLALGISFSKYVLTTRLTITLSSNFSLMCRFRAQDMFMLENIILTVIKNKKDCDTLTESSVNSDNFYKTL